MKVRQISTENPVTEQWRLLSQFTFTGNVRKHMTASGFATIEEETVEFAVGNMRQAQAYFSAAAAAPLDVSPLLVYYGATSLLGAVSAMLKNSPLQIRNHGMTLQEGTAARVADVIFQPRNPTDGALQLFCNVFSGGCNMISGDTWTLGEILGSIPDLKSDFESHYPDLPSYCAPLESIKTSDRALDRISNQELSRFPNPQDAMGRVIDLRKCYLAPQYQPEHVILFRRRNAQEIGTYAISGQRYIDFMHVKRRQPVSPHQIILMFMGLYVLGFLPRYRPHLWNPFVRSDATGEKYIIDRFVSVCIRYFPNLALDFVFGDWIQFVNKPEGYVDRAAITTRDEVKEIVKEALREMGVAGGAL